MLSRHTSGPETAEIGDLLPDIIAKFREPTQEPQRSEDWYSV